MLATGLAACLPVAVSVGHGLQERFYPNGDRAVITARAYDVLSTHPPLVGQYSASSVLLGQPVHSPGPMLYWLLAVPAHISPAAVAVTMGLANAACIVGLLLLARRRGGVALMLATAIAVALMTRSLVPETYHDIWNPAAGVLPLLLLAFLSWSVACGDYRLLPLAVVVASFAAQCQLAFVPPSVGMLGVAIAGLGAWRIAQARRLVQARRRPQATTGPAGEPEDPSAPDRDAVRAPTAPSRIAVPRLWPWWSGALAAGLISWGGPIVDQLVNHPGNLGLIARLPGAQGKTEGLTVGWHAVVRAIGITPWWLRPASDPFGRLAQVTTSPPSSSSTTWCIVLLSLLVVSAAYVALTQRRVDVVAGAVIALVLCAALGSVASATPTRPSLVTSLAYALWWASSAGTWVWLMLAWSLALAARSLVLGPVSPLRSPAARVGAAAARIRGRLAAGPRGATVGGWLAPPRLRAAAAVLGLGAAGAVAASVAFAEGPDQDRPEYGPIRSAISTVDHALAQGDRRILVTGSHSFTAFDFRAALVYELRARGLRPFATGGKPRFGDFYDPDHHRVHATVSVWDGPKPRGGGKVIGRIGLSAAVGHQITLTLARTPRSRRANGHP